MKKIYVLIVIFICSLFYNDLYSLYWVHLSNSRLGIPSDDDVYTITQDTSGFYWLGTYLGNVVLLLDTNKFLTIKDNEKNINKFDLRKSCG